MHTMTNQCLFMCSDKWSDLEKARSHTLHLNGLSPVCLRKWRVNSSDLANRHVQPSHVHTYGFSPEREIHISSLTEVMVCSILEGFNHMHVTYPKLTKYIKFGTRETTVQELSTCMCSSVSFQVWALCVNFVAAIKVTPVNPSLFFSVYKCITSGCHGKRLTFRSRWTWGTHHFKLTEIDNYYTCQNNLKCTSFKNYSSERYFPFIKILISHFSIPYENSTNVSDSEKSSLY